MLLKSRSFSLTTARGRSMYSILLCYSLLLPLPSVRWRRNCLSGSWGFSWAPRFLSLVSLGIVYVHLQSTNSSYDQCWIRRKCSSGWWFLKSLHEWWSLFTKYPEPLLGACFPPASTQCSCQSQAWKKVASPSPLPPVKRNSPGLLFQYKGLPAKETEGFVLHEGSWWKSGLWKHDAAGKMSSPRQFISPYTTLH